MKRSAPRRPEVHSIPAGVPFGDALAAGVKRRAGDDPEALVRYTILLPTRRACRGLREAFLRLGDGRPMLLPRLLPLGELDDEDLSLLGWEAEPAGGGALDPGIPPAIGGLRRQLLLARLIRTRADAQGDDISPDQAARLAQELARLMDQVHTERLSLDDLADLAPEEYADHWRITLDFLSLLSEHWPHILADEGCLDPAERRNRLLDARAAAWRADPPADPVIAAGSTGSIPATADLLAVIASLPAGAVVLPGLDRDLSEESWRELEPSHPQYGLARLLERLDVARDAVTDWRADPLPVRAHLINTALRPAVATGAAARLDEATLGGLDSALAGVGRIDCATAIEEAAAVALAVREVLETPGRTVAVVTPDRALARRVAADLRRWEVEVDDSAGLPLGQTPPGAFLRLTAQMVADELAPVPLLAALKHPLAAGGQAVAAFRAEVRTLERGVLRGLRPGPGIAGLRAALSEKTAHLEPFLSRLERAVHPLVAALSRRRAPLRELLRAHVDAAEALAAGADDSDRGAARLWAGEAGEAAADFVAELSETGDLLAGIDGHDYPALLETLMGTRVVRPRFGRHPRVAILGLLEARLQHADQVILAGLNEGTWPPEAHASPWMSRPMMARFGLPLPERRVGLTAHDFVQGFCAPEVVITRAERDEGTPTVPSRWLVRLDNLLDTTAAGAKALRRPSRLSWVAQLDQPDRVAAVAPPAPRPPVAARPTGLSVTQVETWIRDPYAIFARHILGLRPLDPLDADVGAADRGIVVHQALEKFIKSCPHDLPTDALDRLLDIGRDVFREYRDRPAVRAFWWPRFERIAAWFVDFERRRRAAGTVPLLTEAKGKLTIPGPAGVFTLGGIADRIDRLPDGSLAIVDYKTGAPPSDKQVDAGLTPQLSLEAAMAAAGGFEDLAAAEVAELLYIRLSGGRDPGAARPVKRDVGELAAAARAGLQKRVATFQFAETPYRSRPVPMFEGRFGDYDHLARVKEWRAAGDGDE